MARVSLRYPARISPNAAGASSPQAPEARHVYSPHPLQPLILKPQRGRHGDSCHWYCDIGWPGECVRVRRAQICYDAPLGEWRLVSA
jgi:hypothetical protein